MCEDLLRSGVKVLIKRNDGRTHHAIVSAVSHGTRYVAVEWFENGETKGKEVDVVSILELNPHLKGEERNTKAEDFRREGRKRTCMSMPSRSKSAAEKNRDQEGDGLKNRSKLPKTSSCLSLDKLPATSPQRQRGTDSRLVPKQRKFNAPSPVRESKTQVSPSKVPHKKKCSTVKEIEKLQKNRELRRLKQAEKKEEKEALMTTHCGNPNWQFQAMIRDYQDKMEFKPLTDTDVLTENHQITVCVRKRPVNRKEKLAKEVDVVSVPRRNIVVIHEPKNKVDLTKYLENQQFCFDYIFDEMCNNETVYNFTAKPLVETVFEGGMATCFAYGQTGSGKTHTMSGAGKTGEKGIYAMVAVDVFKYLKYPVNEEKKLVVSASYYEIYGGKVYDLLAKNARLRVLEDGKQQVQIVGLTEKVVHSFEEVLGLIVCGNNARTSGRTSANSCSSRSHAIFQITLRQLHSHNVYGRIHLIDLAGNERGADTSSASRITRLEGAEINKSLLALKECIRALGRKGAHLPFRGSTLTLVLRDSFIGDKTKTCMIAMISPGMSSCEHTLNTLRYADRVKELGGFEVLDQPHEKDKSGWPSNKGYTIYESEEEPSTGLGSPSPKKEKPSLPPATSQKSNKLQHMEQEMVEAFEKWIKICPKFDSTESKLLLTRAVDVLRCAGKNKKSFEEKRPEWRSNLSESDMEEDNSMASRLVNSPTSKIELNRTQTLELQMLAAFQLWTQLCPKFNQMDGQLLAEAHQLQYDPTKFTAELDRVLAERHKFLTGLRDRVTAFRLQITENQ